MVCDCCKATALPARPSTERSPYAVPALPDPGDYVRLPGLYRRWELGRVIGPGQDFHLEAAGTASDGTSLFALYSRPRDGGESKP